MAYTLPVLELEEIPLKLDSSGRLTWCRMNDEAVLATFHLGLEADADGEWEITSIHIGPQELRQGSDIYRRFAQHFEAEHASKISEHCADNLTDAIEGAHLDFSYDKTKFAPSELEVA